MKLFYYESIKRELKKRLIYEYRCDERLKSKTEESTRLADMGWSYRSMKLEAVLRVREWGGSRGTS
jgi:hypothetical protein